MTARILSLLTVALLQTALAAQTCQAAELGGVTFPESVERDGKTLLLNGMGIRKATFFRISVYVAALYLAKKTSEADSILCCSTQAHLRMRFVRDVDVDRIRSGWIDGFKNNIGDLTPLKKNIDRFNAIMKPVKEGQTLSLDIHPTSVRVVLDDEHLGTVEGKDFPAAVLRIWLGASPPNEDLKAGLLGHT